MTIFPDYLRGLPAPPPPRQTDRAAWGRPAGERERIWMHALRPDLVPPPVMRTATAWASRVIP